MTKKKASTENQVDLIELTKHTSTTNEHQRRIRVLPTERHQTHYQEKSSRDNQSVSRRAQQTQDKEVSTESHSCIKQRHMKSGKKEYLENQSILPNHQNDKRAVIVSCVEIQDLPGFCPSPNRPSLLYSPSSSGMGSDRFEYSEYVYSSW
jgi:hypothetical protein